MAWSVTYPLPTYSPSSHYAAGSTRLSTPSCIAATSAVLRATSSNQYYSPYYRIVAPSPILFYRPLHFHDKVILAGISSGPRGNDNSEQGYDWNASSSQFLPRRMLADHGNLTMHVCQREIFLVVIQHKPALKYSPPLFLLNCPTPRFYSTSALGSRNPHRAYPKSASLFIQLTCHGTHIAFSYIGNRTNHTLPYPCGFLSMTFELHALFFLDALTTNWKNHRIIRL